MSESLSGAEFKSRLGEGRPKLDPVINSQSPTVAEGLAYGFGTSRDGEFLDKGFPFISVGDDLHRIRTQAGAYIKDAGTASEKTGPNWTRRPTALI